MSDLRDRLTQALYEPVDPLVAESAFGPLARNDAALACRAAVAISGYPSDLYDTALSGWHRHEIPTHTGGRGTQTRRATEVLWVNRP